MKKNLFTLFLAVVMIAAVVFVAAPTAKAAEVHTAEADNAVLAVAAGDTVNLSGKKNVTINVTGDGAIYLVDTANLEDLTGAASGSATVNGVVAEYVQHDGFKYLAVKAEDGTYSAHPFNLTVDKYGVNTAYSAVSVRVTVIADNTVAALIDAGEFGMHRTASTEGAIKEYFPHWKTFAGEDGEIATNGLRAYYYLDGSFATGVLADETIATVGAYIKLDGYETIESNQTQTINPLNILNTLNAKAATAGTFSDVQWVKMQDMLDKNAHMKDYCGKFLPGWKLVTDASTLKAGDQIVLVAKNTGFAMSTTPIMNPSNATRQIGHEYTAIAQAGNFIKFGDSVQLLTLVAGQVDGTFGLYTGKGYLITYANGYQMHLVGALNDPYYRDSFEIAINDGVANFIAPECPEERIYYRYLNFDGTMFTTSKNATEILEIYTFNCPHNYESVVTAPTCTEDGYTTYTCAYCGDTYTEAGEVAAHNFDENTGVCTICGTSANAKMPADTEYPLAGIAGTHEFDDGTVVTVVDGIYNASGIRLPNDTAYFVVEFPALVDKITFTVTRANYGVKVYVSEDGINWGEYVYFKNKLTTHTVDLPDSYRFVKFVNTSTSSYNIFTSLIVNPSDTVAE